MIPIKIIHLLSGGLDSVVLLHELIAQGNNVHCLLFDYGQTHIKELAFAKQHCTGLGVTFTVIELHRIKGLFGHSALTDGAGSNIVPNRNAVFLHIATSIAASEKANMVTIGCNKDDQNDFPDCRWPFIQAMNSTLKAAEIDVEICAPYIGLTKKQIVGRAKKFKVAIASTWSCYAGKQKPCGKCDACKKLKGAR